MAGYVSRHTWHMSPEPSDEEDREVISILERRDGVATVVILRDGIQCLACDIVYGYDEGDAVAHVTTNISPGEPGRAIDFFRTSDVGAIRDAASGEALFIAAGWPLPERDAHGLLTGLCVDFGFCLPPDDHDRLLERPPLTVDEFTDAVIRADGMDPALMEPRFRAPVRERVAAAFAKADPLRGRSRSAGVMPSPGNGRRRRGMTLASGSWQTITIAGSSAVTSVSGDVRMERRRGRLRR
jgi:hypothetical protein